MIANLGRLTLVVTLVLIAATAAFAATAEATPPAAPPAAASAPAAETNIEPAGVCAPVVADTVDLFDRAAGQGDSHRKGCPAGIRSCPSSQVGQPCDPNNLSLVCSAQANGSYCCLAYAGSADGTSTNPADIAAPGGGPCCTHDDKTSCTASCQAAGCTTALAACINLRCSCRCSGCQ